MGGKCNGYNKIKGRKDTDISACEKIYTSIPPFCFISPFCLCSSSVKTETSFGQHQKMLERMVFSSSSS